ncbi:hypothetical protein AB0E55_26850 [Amycolatopsis keratiniphila]|uniref:hypothetical protein n=1 Tax=Amycolatopsis keratiniphila TaxID=129921 RepID=UPI000399AFCA|nr:hypothetical protein [Amycolatopsis keratiniphila]
MGIRQVERSIGVRTVEQLRFLVTGPPTGGVNDPSVSIVDVREESTMVKAGG